MILKRSQLVLAALAVATFATSAFGEVNYRPLNGSLTPVNYGDVHGFTWESNGNPNPAEVLPGNLYDNIPTASGGTATGPVSFFDWTTNGPGWGDDVHGTPGTINTIHFAYVNNSTVGAVANISILVANGTPGADPTLATLPITPVATVGGISAVPGTFLVSVTGLSIPFTGDAWLHLVDSGAGEANTFFMTGPVPGNGTSFDHVGYGLGPAATYPLSAGVLGLPIAANVGFALNQIPEPTALSLLGIAGIAFFGLRRRS